MTKLLVNAVALVGCVLIGYGCASTLEPGGAYAPGALVVSTDPSGVTTTNFTPAMTPDRALFDCDCAFELVWTVVEGVFRFERDNRAALWAVSPEIKHSLDRLRPKAWAFQVQWASARRAYLRNPTPGGIVTMKTILGQLRQLADAALAALPPPK